MLNITLRRKAEQFTKLVRRSVFEPRVGESFLPQLAREDELALTFIGHSAFVLQIHGRTIAIDPNYARWLFILKRLRRPGVRLKDLPAIDYVLVTHAHFDHLHRPTLKRIAKRSLELRGRAPAIIVPRQVADLVGQLGYSEVVELGWWENFTDKGITIHHVPARHWGARVIRDTHRGYGGYVISANGRSLYHAGDTAYFGGFRDIGRRLAPQIALLPIGAYHPESFRNVHTSPEDALQGFFDLGAQWMVPMHYGTFRLSHEPMEEPLQRLEAAAKKAGVSDKVVVVSEGATRFFEPEAGRENKVREMGRKPSARKAAFEAMPSPDAAKEVRRSPRK